MYHGDNFRIADKETFEFRLPEGRPVRILQLTDLHLGFGWMARKLDRKAMEDVTTIVERTKPDLIVLTGDTIFPFFLRTGTVNNKKQAAKFMEFMDMFRIPYALVMGNHDAEIGSKLNREQLGNEFRKGEYSIFAHGPKDIFGAGNYFIHLVKPDDWDAPLPNGYCRSDMALVMLDSNMYGKGWLTSGFDRIHADQTKWCMDRLEWLREYNPDMKAMAFFHMPVKEYKIAYEKMKLGDTSVKFHFGGISEKEDYFGISRYKEDFFEKAHENGMIKAMFCGHDHLNTISMTYRGIRLTYGMSIDYGGYSGIKKKQTQRGGTVITVDHDGSWDVKPEPLSVVVTPKVRGLKLFTERVQKERAKQRERARARITELEKEREARKKARKEAAARRNAKIKQFYEDKISKNRHTD